MKFHAKSMICKTLFVIKYNIIVIYIRCITALTFLLCYSGANVFAADKSNSTNEYKWDGPYFGVSYGLTHGTTDLNYKVAPYIRRNLSDEMFSRGGTFFESEAASPMTGLTAGYNWQSNNVILGVETDAAILDFETTETVIFKYRTVELEQYKQKYSYGTKYFSYKSDWFGTTRARVGIAYDNWLVYGTAGIAYNNINGSAGFDAELFGRAFSESVSEEGNNLGVVVGGGIEYGKDRMRIGVDMLQIKFKRAEFDLGIPFKQQEPATSRDRAIKISGSIDSSFLILRTVIKYAF